MALGSARQAVLLHGVLSAVHRAPTLVQVLRFVDVVASTTEEDTALIGMLITVKPLLSTTTDSLQDVVIVELLGLNAAEPSDAGAKSDDLSEWLAKIEHTDGSMTLIVESISAKPRIQVTLRPNSDETELAGTVGLRLHPLPYGNSPF